MDNEIITKELIEQTIGFHGHWCPGLAVGIRAAEWALREMGKAPDEEIVAVVKTDMCAVDAIQYLTGCTFGKGNLIHRDYGKNAFTFYRREDGKAARLIGRPNIYGNIGADMGKLNKKMAEQGLNAGEQKIWNETRAAMSKKVMEADLTELFEIKEPVEPVPGKARIVSSVVCDSCGEAVMETRTKQHKEQVLCIPCFEARGK